MLENFRANVLKAAVSLRDKYWFWCQEVVFWHFLNSFQGQWIVEPEASNLIWHEKDVFLYFVCEICIGGAFFSQIVQNPAWVVAW